ncbi:hypothetical protein DQT32_03665 [Salmonella enterica subsp. enterica serovar Braenderup]|nr:hypothetical protein [Salmonella enterica subsp. enterica serovar Braenderup]
MAIVTQASIDNLKAIHERAKTRGDYQSAYNVAQQGLVAAISQLEQLQVITENFEVVIIPSRKKDTP